MDLVDDAEVEAWLLEEWDGSLQWDQGNTGKLQKHDVSVDEVESVFDGDFIFGGRIKPQTGSAWSEDRYVIFGTTSTRRDVAIIWTRRSTSLRSISCRSMRDGEKKIYRSRKNR